MKDRIRAIIVDDEPLAREGVRLHLEAENDVEVIGEAGDGERAVLVEDGGFGGATAAPVAAELLRSLR